MATSVSMCRLEEQLRCPVCLDHYKDPRGLPCLHSFCKKCLEELPVQIDEEETRKLSCPTCRSTIPVPVNGMGDLPTAFHINTLLDLYEVLQQESTEHDSGDVPECNLHGKSREFFCQTCDELVCSVCAVRGHREHDCDTTDEFFGPKKQEIEDNLLPVKECINTFECRIGSFQDEISDAHSQADSIKVEIVEFIDELHQTIETLKQQLFRDLDILLQQNLQRLAQQRERVETMLMQMKSYHEFIEDKLRIGSQQQILAVKRQVIGHMKALIWHLDTDLLKQFKCAIFFNLNRSALSSCTNVGSLCQIQFDQCEVSCKQVAVVGKEANFSIHTKGIGGIPVSLPMDHLISCHHASNDHLLQSNINNRDGINEVSFVPEHCGPYKLRVQIGDKTILPELSIIRVVPSSLDEISPCIRSLQSINTPSGITLTTDNKIIVAERQKNCIAIFSNEGERLHTFGSAGSEDGQFNTLSDLVVTHDEEILVVDTGNHRIQKFSIEGEFLSTIGRHGKGHLQFNFPTGISIHPDGRVFIADRLNSRIQVLNPDLTYLQSFGEKGKNRGQFLELFDVAVDSKGMIYTTDPIKGEIQQFTSNGEFITAIHCKKPYFVCIDQHDTLYVMREVLPIRQSLADIIRPQRYAYLSHDHFISLYSSEGQHINFLAEFRSSRNCPDSGCAGRIAVDTSGYLYACNPQESSVDVY